METRLQRIFLNGLATTLLLAGAAASADNFAADAVSAGAYDPKVERREIKTGAIDTENYEIGFAYGILSIDDFGVNELRSLRFNYHISEDFFLQAVYGESKASTTSYERLSGGVDLLTDEERNYKYYSVSLGLNVLPGETFISETSSFNSTFYVLAGVGNTTFAGDDQFTINFGAGYQFIFLDWLTAFIEAQDHLFDVDVTGENRKTNNIEFSTGMTFFF